MDIVHIPILQDMSTEGLIQVLIKKPASQAVRRRQRKQKLEKAEDQRMIALLDGKSESDKSAKKDKSKVAATTDVKESKEVKQTDTDTATDAKLDSGKEGKEVKEVKEVKSRPAKKGQGQGQGQGRKEAGDGSSSESRGPRWHEITSEYGEWVDEFARLRHIFDGSGRFESIYNEYGYDSLIPVLDHHVIPYHDRVELYAAKKCYGRREEYLKALAALPEITSVQNMMYDAAAEAWPTEEGLRYAQVISNSLVREMNAFLLYAMVVNPDSPKTGGFSFFHPSTGATVYAWREGTKQVSVEMKTGGDDQKLITDRKEIFKFMGNNTKLMHEMFYARTRRDILSALTGFMCDGWVVIPNCCEQ